MKSMDRNPVWFYKTLVIGIVVIFVMTCLSALPFTCAKFLQSSASDNNPPEAPEIYGPVRGKPHIEYAYGFSTEDPEGDDVSYYIEWGDGTTTGWTDYFGSGEEVTISHTWDKIDWHNTIRAKAKDIYGAEGNWSVTVVPINIATVDFFILRLLERFPMLERLLPLIRLC